MKGIDYIQAQTFHGRKGKISNSFSYAVDYLLLDLKKPKQFLSLFSFNDFLILGRTAFFALDIFAFVTPKTSPTLSNQDAVPSYPTGALPIDGLPAASNSRIVAV